MSLQVNDPSARQAGLVNMLNMEGMNFFVDPIQSEIQVLNSSAIREQVVDSVGLRLTRMDGGPRSDLVRYISVHPDMPDGFYRLVYNSDGSRAQLNTPDGTTLAETTAGTTLDAGLLSFVLQKVDDEAPRAYDLEIIPGRSAASEISLAAEPRIDTNIVDISLVQSDQWLTSRIPRLRRLEHAAEGADQLAGRGVPLVVAMDPLDPAAEAYRNLRMNLMSMSSDEEPIRTVLFSSPGPSEGKSTTAVNFAVMLAQQGQRVLLSDSDLRRPSLHRALDLLREPGLTNLLNRRCRTPRDLSAERAS